MAKISSLCVFCGSKTGADPAYEAAARRLGELMVANDVGLVYGGGHIGLMGVVADTVLQSGGRVTGVIPDFLEKLEVGFTEATEFIVTDSMHARKQRMFELSDGFVVLPGGLGTLDETFEIITWKQLRLHSKPIVIMDVNGYWKGLSGLVDGTIEAGFAHPAVRQLFGVVDGPDAVFDALAAAPEPKEEVLTSHL